VDMYVPGCPPRPEMLMGGILLLHEKIRKGEPRARLVLPEGSGRRGPGNPEGVPRSDRRDPGNPEGVPRSEGPRSGAPVHQEA
jgi:hypothetical protein